MENFKRQYRDLESRVLNELRSKIEKSNYRSVHTGQKAIKLYLFDYDEITIINDRLTFLNSSGYHYDLFTVGLNDLIEILNQ